MTTMADLDELALAMPQATKEVSDDGRPAYFVHGKLLCFHRGRRADAVDPETGERLEDVLMFRVADLDVKELMLADDRGIFFTTPHFNGYAAVLMHILDLARRDVLTPADDQLLDPAGRGRGSARHAEPLAHLRHSHKRPHRSRDVLSELAHEVHACHRDDREPPRNRGQHGSEWCSASGAGSANHHAAFGKTS